MITIIAVLVVLLLAGVRILGGTGSQARKAGTDMLTGMIERGRTSAITSRSHVVLAIAEPGDLPAGDERCRLGLFRVDTDAWADAGSGTIEGVLMSRWKVLETGVVLIGGDVDGVENPVGGQELTIRFGSASSLSVKAHCLAFDPRGGLCYPAGSAPVVLRVAEGGYRGGEAAPNKRGDSGVIAENRLKIGRVIARPYRNDG